MGNKLGRRQVVDEKYTRPQGLYQHKDVDQKKLRKLILGAKLAPCYPGGDDCGCDLEECPICFLYYPSLNRSRCCMKGICTECFLQMKTTNSTRPTQCPFCKTANYAVEYRGVKTQEEKGLEQFEEQRVIEAKIRMRRQELQDDEERMLKRTEISSSSSMSRPSGVDYCSTRAPSFSSAVESEEIVASHVPNAASTLREDNFDIDLEDILVMEAIWLSIQENGRCQDPPFSDPAQFSTAGDCSTLVVTDPRHGSSSSSPASGLACAKATLAERQQTNEETANNYSAGTSTYSVPGFSRFSHHEPETYLHAESAIAASPDSQLAMTDAAGQWVVDPNRPEVAEIGATSSYEGSNEFHDAATGPCAIGQHDEIQCSSSFQPVAGPIIPESYEEQVMIAMAISLAEARARNNSPPGVAWH